MKPDKCRGKRKEAHYNYLSADFQYHRSTKAAVTHMKAIGLGEEAVKSLISKTHDEGKKLRPDKYDWIEGDESVPEGDCLQLILKHTLKLVHFKRLEIENCPLLQWSRERIFLGS